MLSGISWQNYWTAVVILSLVYYLALYLLYFRKDLVLSLRKPKEGVAIAAMPSSLPEQSEEELFDHALNELSAFFEEAKKIRWEKSELLYSLQRLFTKYTSLKNTSFSETLIRIIRTQAEDSCSVHLKEEDVVHVWLK